MYNQKKQNIFLDKAYHSKEVVKVIFKREYNLNINAEKKKNELKKNLTKMMIYRELIHDTINLGKSLQEMKRKIRTPRSCTTSKYSYSLQEDNFGVNSNYLKIIK